MNKTKHTHRKFFNLLYIWLAIHATCEICDSLQQNVPLSRLHLMSDLQTEEIQYQILEEDEKLAQHWLLL